MLYRGTLNNLTVLTDYIPDTYTRFQKALRLSEILLEYEELHETLLKLDISNQ